MNSSLRDQLLKAGFVDQKQARQAELEKKQQAKDANKARKSGQPLPPSPEQLAAERARQERQLHAQRSRELNHARDEELARKGLRAEVKRLIQTSAVPHGKGDIRYHFVKGTKVKRLYVDKAQQEGLARRSLAIVEWDGSFYLLPSEAAAKAKERVPETFVFLAEEQDPDDPYAAFPMPEEAE
ncbi:MAG: DUF2058 domain-containing protein [Deltaproteobacteria bacterium]|nr:DUF2058 domain-containing protein [Deltaproteobacteria bacterium]